MVLVYCLGLQYCGDAQGDGTVIMLSAALMYCPSPTTRVPLFDLPRVLMYCSVYDPRRLVFDLLSQSLCVTHKRDIFKTALGMTRKGCFFQTALFDLPRVLRCIVLVAKCVPVHCPA